MQGYYDRIATYMILEDTLRQAKTQVAGSITSVRTTVKRRRESPQSLTISARAQPMSRTTTTNTNAAATTQPRGEDLDARARELFDRYRTLFAPYEVSLRGGTLQAAQRYEVELFTRIGELMTEYPIEVQKRAMEIANDIEEQMLNEPNQNNGEKTKSRKSIWRRQITRGIVQFLAQKVPYSDRIATGIKALIEGLNHVYGDNNVHNYIRRALRRKPWAREWVALFTDRYNNSNTNNNNTNNNNTNTNNNNNNNNNNTNNNRRNGSIQYNNSAFNSTYGNGNNNNGNNNNFRTRRRQKTVA
jgi:hypothetical protein